MEKFRQGDTTTVIMELNKPIGDLNIKVGFYDIKGNALYEATTKDNIEKISDREFVLHVSHDAAMKLAGPAQLRITMFSDDRKLVNAGETHMALNFDKEPVNRRI